MSDTQMCYKCQPPREIGPGQIEGHNKDVHDGGKHKVPHPRRPVDATPVWTTEDQVRMDQAVREACANLAQVMPPIVAAFQSLAVQTLPALAKAFEPMLEWKTKYGAHWEAAARGETLAEEMDSGLDCLRCDPTRRVAPGKMKEHMDRVHREAAT